MIPKNGFLTIQLCMASFIAISCVSCTQKTKIDSIKMAVGSVESTVTTINSGTVEAKNQAELAFGGIGRISKIYKSLGAKVNSGDIIAELENADLKAVYDETLKEFNRANELFKNGLVSISNLDSAKRAREVAKLNLEKTIIKAPFAGMITSMDLKIGEFYQSATTQINKPFVQIIDLKKRIIKGEIDEVDLQKVSIGFLARVKIPALKNHIFKAKVTNVVPFVSTAKDQDRTSHIELEIIETSENKFKEILIPVGASADVEIISESKEGVNILPANVLSGTGKTRFVYKIVNGKLVKNKVTLGLGNYDRVEIIQGITPDELIARPGNGIELIEGMKVQPIESKWL